LRKKLVFDIFRFPGLARPSLGKAATVGSPDIIFDRLAAKGA
jgi:hypothetical protein